MAAEKSIFFAFIASIISAAIILGGCTKINKKVEKAYESEKTGYNSVVSLSRSVSDIWLLAGGKLKGTTYDAMDLDGISEDTVSIGSPLSPSTEAVIALKPDLILISPVLAAHREMASRLEGLGTHVEAVDIESFQDYSETLLRFTKITGRDDLYEKNALEVQKRIDGILSSFNSSVTKGKSYLCLRVSATKNKALKKDNFACSIIDSFGLKNIADDSSSMSDLNLEAVAIADPDYIFIIFQGKEAEAANVYDDVFKGQAAWRKLSAVQNGRVVVLPKNLFHFKPNAKWDEAYRYIYEIFE